MPSPRDWSPRKPLEFSEHDKKVFRDLVREFPEPERLWIAAGAHAAVWNELHWMLENRTMSKEVTSDIRKIKKEIEEVLRGTPWFGEGC